MESQTMSKPSCRLRRRTRAIHVVGLAVVTAGAAWVGGCSHSEEKVPPAEVKTVEAYGVTLDPSASPQQVAYVLLRSIADDYAAARAKDYEAEKKAQDLTYSLAAFDEIERRLLGAARQLNQGTTKAALGPQRAAKIFKTVHYWAPIVGHYVPSFARHLPTFVRDSWVTIEPNGRTAHVYYPVSHNPQVAPAKAETATIIIELSRERAQAGGAEYWRVVRVYFLGRQFPAPVSPRIVQDYGLTLDESATPQDVATVTLRSLGDLLAADKAGAANRRASALCRLFNVSFPAPAVAKSGQVENPGEGQIDEPITRALAATILIWVRQVQPWAAVLTDPASVGPEQMSAGTAGGGANSQVTYAVTSVPGKITLDLARESWDGKAFWRVVNVNGSPAADQTPASRPETGTRPGTGTAK